MKTGREEGWHRQYVDVSVLHKHDGGLAILKIYWPDGRAFTVSETVEGPYAQSPYTGAPGKRYTVTIQGMKRDIYLQKDRFFVDVPGYGGEDNTFYLNETDWKDIELALKKAG